MQLKHFLVSMEVTGMGSALTFGKRPVQRFITIGVTEPSMLSKNYVQRNYTVTLIVEDVAYNK